MSNLAYFAFVDRALCALLLEAVQKIQGLPQLFQTIEWLHLQMRQEPGVFDPSMFPALKTLIVDQDRDLSGTLSILFSSPESSPNLRDLVLGASWFSEVSEVLVRELVVFLSKRGFAPLDRVAIAHWKNAAPSDALIEELAANVKEVSVEIGLPTYTWALSGCERLKNIKMLGVF
jgi:hypothetical protein